MKTQTELSGSRLTLFPQGELDHHAAASVVGEIERSIDSALPRECVIDMSGVTFMDSSGIAVVLKAHRRMSELSGKLRLVRVPERCRRILAAAGVERLVEIETRETVHNERT
ncbi:MAG: STAS domain-containing protein [Oscillospiraceae bacterium]|jgi:stage II sporulation protein AA (anti-sigma F factor antagonist)|nr:STAS domain-containing protein [Oscillospiraceae bacterium]